MYKILSISDTHFDLSTDGIEDPETGLNSRTMDIFQAFEQVIDYAIANKVDCIVHSGDVFNSKHPKQNSVDYYYKLIKKLTDNKIFCYTLHGNHDANLNLTKKNGLDIGKTVDIPYTYFTRGNDYLDLGAMQIVSLSYWNTTESIIEFLDEIAKQVDWTRPAILVGHLQVDYPDFPGAYKEDLTFVPVEALNKHPFKFVQLGHIHKAQILSQSPLTFYTGSLVRTSFTEEFDNKFFWEFTFDDVGNFEYKHIPITCLKMLTIKGNMSEIREALEEKSTDSFVDTIVRCVIDANDEPVDEKLLKQKFAKAFKFRFTKLSKKREIHQIQVAGLKSVTDYASKYFANDPDKDELLSLIKEINDTEEGA